MADLTTSTSGNLTLIFNPGLCTLDTCDFTLSQTGYRPNLGGNTFYTALFGLFFLAQIYQGVRHKTWGFMVAMLFGIGLEIIGYAARIMLNINPFNRDAFLMYIVCLTIGPAFLSAAVYLCLARIVIAYGESASRFRPATYTIVFCSFDFLSLLLQAIGGAIASTANDQSTTQTGINIMLAGLASQVASLLLFAALCGEFAWRLYKAPQSWSLKHQQLYTSRLFQAFLWGLAVATLAIFIRSVFRVAELSGGFDGPLASNEGSFMALEGAMIVIACACLTLLHPGTSFQGVWSEANFRFRKSKEAQDVEKTTGGTTPDSS